MKGLKIGDVRIKNRLFLSPMVDVTDLAYRMLCKKYGAGMVYTEMLNIGSILHENRKTKELMKTCKDERPVGIQITGKSVDDFRKVIPYVSRDKGWDLVDINCGCPSIRITGNESGSYLLKNPEKVGEMIKVLKDSGLTVSVKIRLGFKKNNVLKVAKEIEKSGADALAVHARLANQGASVKAEWKWIGKVKRSVGVPVIGNGDVFSGEESARMLDICDGVMIARGAIGNPLIFREALRFLRTGKEKEILLNERIESFREYLDLCKKYDVVDLSRVKFIGGNFLKGFEGAVKSREKFMQLKSFDEIERFVKQKLK
jgi:tRNA-dihydrouridine synthase B